MSHVSPEKSAGERYRKQRRAGSFAYEAARTESHVQLRFCSQQAKMHDRGSHDMEINLNSNHAEVV
jgi:hypothetical protein